MRDTEHRAMAEYESRLEMADTRIRELEARESGPTVEQCLKELREMFPGEFFRIEVHQCAQVDEHGNIWWREKYANIMMLSRGLDNFPSKPSLSEAMAQVRAWHKAQELNTVLPEPQSELPICLKCGHSDDTDKNGICQTQIGAQNWEPCRCKCMFPPPPTIMQIAKQIARDFLAIQANFAAIDHERTLTNYIASALQLRRERALRDAANDVCMYCDGRAVGYEPAVGPNTAGNYTHEATNKRLLVTSGGNGIVLCAASAIHTRIKYEAAIRAAKQQ